MIFWGSVCLLLLTLGLDQWLKLWVSSCVASSQEIIVIPHCLSITNVKNQGAAWSILTGQQWLFVSIAVAALVIMAYYFWQCRYDWRYEIILSLLLSGTLGNLISRFVDHFVTDMFQLIFINFPVFNLADSCLTLGVLGLMLLIGTDQKVKGYEYDN